MQYKHRISNSCTWPSALYLLLQYFSRSPARLTLIYIFGSGSLDPVYVHGVKCAGHSQITVAVSALSNPQVHELLIRCLYVLLNYVKNHFL
jgi:hypothetical protein